MADGTLALVYQVGFAWVPNGASAMEIQSSQVLTLFPSTNSPSGVTGDGGLGSAAPIPGGSQPTLANVATALTNLSTDIQAQLSANGSALLARIQAFSTGGG